MISTRNAAADLRQPGLIVPSKFYGIAAAGRPIVMIGDGEGEIARFVQRHHCGITIAPGNAATLADTLRRWSEAPEALAEMGARAANTRRTVHPAASARAVDSTAGAVALSLTDQSKAKQIGGHLSALT